MPIPTPLDELDELGRLIRGSREKLDLSQDRLAEILGTSQSIVSELELGRDGLRVSSEMALKLESALGVPLADVVRASAARVAARRSAARVS